MEILLHRRVIKQTIAVFVETRLPQQKAALLQGKHAQQLIILEFANVALQVHVREVLMHQHVMQVTMYVNVELQTPVMVTLPHPHVTKPTIAVFVEILLPQQRVVLLQMKHAQHLVLLEFVNVALQTHARTVLMPRPVTQQTMYANVEQ